MNRLARMHQDGLMRVAMRDMTDNAVQALIDRDPQCCEMHPDYQDWPPCRDCRWGAMASAEMHKRNFIRNAPRRISHDRVTHQHPQRS